MNICPSSHPPSTFIAPRRRSNYRYNVVNILKFTVKSLSAHSIMIILSAMTVAERTPSRDLFLVEMIWWVSLSGLKVILYKWYRLEHWIHSADVSNTYEILGSFPRHQLQPTLPAKHATNTITNHENTVGAIRKSLMKFRPDQQDACRLFALATQF